MTGRWNQEHSKLSELFAVVKDLRAGSLEFKHEMTPEAFNAQPSFKRDLGGEHGLRISLAEALEVLFYCLQAGRQPRCTSWAHKYNIIGAKNPNPSPTD